MELDGIDGGDEEDACALYGTADGLRKKREAEDVGEGSLIRVRLLEDDTDERDGSDEDELTVPPLIVSREEEDRRVGDPGGVGGRSRANSGERGEHQNVSLALGQHSDYLGLRSL